jgi:hypothetical protein
LGENIQIKDIWAGYITPTFAFNKINNFEAENW